MKIREATAAEAATIASLHAESWRAAYRGILTDKFLDNDVHRERLALWQERFAVAATNARETHQSKMFVLLAQQDSSPPRDLRASSSKTIQLTVLCSITCMSLPKSLERELAASFFRNAPAD